MRGQALWKWMHSIKLQQNKNSNNIPFCNLMATLEAWTLSQSPLNLEQQQLWIFKELWIIKELWIFGSIWIFWSFGFSLQERQQKTINLEAIHNMHSSQSYSPSIKATLEIFSPSIGELSPPLTSNCKGACPSKIKHITLLVAPAYKRYKNKIRNRWEANKKLEFRARANAQLMSQFNETIISKGFSK